MDTVRDIAAHTRQKQVAENMAALASDYNQKDLERQVTRRWKVGDVYAPHDLTGVEAAKWKKLRRKGKLRTDVVDLLGINPVEHYKVGGFCNVDLVGLANVSCRTSR